MNVIDMPLEQAAIFNDPYHGEDDPTPIYNTTDKDWEIIINKYKDKNISFKELSPVEQRMFLCFVALSEGRELPSICQGIIMKKSEAIRQAVDTLLLPNFDNTLSKPGFLILDNVLSEVLSFSELQELATNEFQIFYKYNIFRTEERQIIRFMYAEFLALMWEDEEANAQAEVS